MAERLVEVAATPVIVIDGVYSARPELRDVVDLAIIVDTPPAVRQQRLISRGHGNDIWWPRWDAAEERYFTDIRPASSFDLVVAGS